ncbi:ribonuclease J [Microvirga sp. W0021]|uniref:Ribonuclease J n=1 Tax=Hohaiivirga grylli TaxID=3133970 RepID=A0ABV0BJ87_9HYPH
MTRGKDELVFLPLGGLGEIGMNAALYGFGPPRQKKWILIDCGMGFGSEESLPGIDVVYPDLKFIEAQRENLLGVIITHAHEDHIGAIADLWSNLKVPVYATPFACGLLETRKLSEPGAPKVELRVVKPGQRFDVGPFNIEYIPVSHSIPEANALALRTPHGLVVHTGDWKLDAAPYEGAITSPETFSKLGDEGVLALVCDSTNVLRDGQSPTETEVAESLAKLIAASPHRVAVTTFASNVARIKAVADAAKKCGRKLVVVGRAIDRVMMVAEECGYLQGVDEYVSGDSFEKIPRDKVVALLTGSQGEPRAAMARIADKTHPDVRFASGDRVIFSARAIPGNERAIGKIINALVRDGVEVITDGQQLVHVSGHPRRGELERMYGWTRPQIAVPAHGEDLHLEEHAKMAKGLGVPEVASIRNGQMLRLAPGPAEVIDEVGAGRIFKDGQLLTDGSDRAIAERRKLSFAGIVSIGIAIDGRGDLAGDPIIETMGLPVETRNGHTLEGVIERAVDNVFSGLPKPRRRDPETVEDAVKRGVRAAVNGVWGKKPACHVMVVEV